MTRSQSIRNTRTYSMAVTALMTAVTCIVAPLSIPIGPVPISLTNLAIYLTLYLLDWKKGTLSYLLYLLIGLAGVPVFSGFTGGAGKLLGPTGGYLIGFAFMALICGILIDRSHHNFVIGMAGMILGTIICYAFGTVWLAYQAGMTMGAALAAGVLPFIPGDLAKMVVAAVVAPQIRRRLAKAKVCAEA